MSKSWFALLGIVLVALTSRASSAQDVVTGKIEHLTSLSVRGSRVFTSFSVGLLHGNELCGEGAYYHHEFENLDEARATYTLLLTAVSTGRKIRFRAYRLEGTTDRCRAEGVGILGFER